MPWPMRRRTFEERLFERLDNLESLIRTVVKQENLIMADLSALTAQVQKNTDAEDSAVVLINGLAAQLKGIANDPVAVAALADQLKTHADALAAAVAANTAPAPAPTPTPAP